MSFGVNCVIFVMNMGDVDHNVNPQAKSEILRIKMTHFSCLNKIWTVVIVLTIGTIIMIGIILGATRYLASAQPENKKISSTTTTATSMGAETNWMLLDKTQSTDVYFRSTYSTVDVENNSISKPRGKVLSCHFILNVFSTTC